VGTINFGAPVRNLSVVDHHSPIACVLVEDYFILFKEFLPAPMLIDPRGGLLDTNPEGENHICGDLVEKLLNLWGHRHQVSACHGTIQEREFIEDLYCAVAKKAA
jgi:hypothetical protein